MCDKTHAIFSLIFISQHKHCYIELFGPGREGSFLSMQRRQGAAKTSSLDVGGEDKAVGSRLGAVRGWARSLGCNVQYALPDKVLQPGKQERL